MPSSSPPDPLATPADLAALGLPQPAIDALEARTPGCTEVALAAATSWALSYLRGRFVLPLTAWDDAVRANVCAYAAAQMLTTLGANPESQADQAVLDRASAAAKWFAGVQAGEISPDITDSASPPTVDDDHVSISTRCSRRWLR